MADRHRWITGAGAGVATATLLAGLAAGAFGSAAAGGSGDGGGSARARATGRSATLSFPYLGAFTDSGAEGVANLAGLQKWLGGTPVRVGHTYLPGGTWDDIEGPQELLQPWADWRRAAADRMFVLNVPMQAGNEERTSDAQVRSLLRQGANGAFDPHFALLAEHLVELGVPDTVIVLGWEMNGTTYAHRCGPDPQGWRAYWRRIVAAMRAVPGQKFRFDFAPSRGTDAVPWTECYPGDDTVDVIGMDSYDQPPGETFDHQVSEPYGLQAQVDFAAQHGKAVSYPEWGLFQNGDDTSYVEQMLRWMSDHHALYQTITDYCPHGVWQCTANPLSSKVFRELLSAPAPTPTPASGTSSPPSPGTGAGVGTSGPVPDAPGTPGMPARATASTPPGKAAGPSGSPTVSPSAASPSKVPGAAAVPSPSGAARG
ncbi:glycosyl hydrolase family 26 [Streptomyces sp. NPDC021224]|uniref:glycoside hydrolase family 26 protein n=1 Tax=unclassified Streptomyces TaxID=2593676 RepID=UPI0037B3B922